MKFQGHTREYLRRPQGRFEDVKHPVYLPTCPAAIQSTVQIINSCTSRPNVCQCLVVQKTFITCQKEVKHINDLRSLRIKITFSCKVIHAQTTGWQSGMRSCILPDLPTHLVQELNVGTVCMYYAVCIYVCVYVLIYLRIISPTLGLIIHVCTENTNI